MDRDEVTALTNRLQRVERRVFLMGAGWLLSIVMLVVLWTGTQHASSQTPVGSARVRSLTIVDQSDRQRLSLGVTDKGNGIFQLYDSNGKERVQLGISTGGNAGAWFYDAAEKTRIHLGVDFGKAPEIWFADENGNERLHLGVADAEARSQFSNQANPPSIWLLYDPAGPARLGFYAAGRERVALGGNGRGDQGIWVFDPGGKAVWSAPHGLFGGVKP
jgi:hypothetical protein